MISPCLDNPTGCLTHFLSDSFSLYVGKLCLYVSSECLPPHRAFTPTPKNLQAAWSGRWFSREDRVHTSIYTDGVGVFVVVVAVAVVHAVRACYRARLRCARTQMLRDQLKERHEQHERGLKEDLELKHKSSKASLLRRRQMRRRSVSQSPCSRGGDKAGGIAQSGFDPSPLRVPASMLPSAVGAGAGASGAGESAEPDLTKYRNMKAVSGQEVKGDVICNYGGSSAGTACLAILLLPLLSSCQVRVCSVIPGLRTLNSGNSPGFSKTHFLPQMWCPAQCKIAFEDAPPGTAVSEKRGGAMEA